MKYLTSVLVLAGLLVLSPLLQAGESGYEEQIREWRDKRDQRLADPDGWLTLVGLEWLEEGANSVGAADGSDARIPGGPASWGTLHLEGDTIRFVPNPSADVTVGGERTTEAVLVAFDPKVVEYEALLRLFWEAHDPTQGMRQGNDVGTQYRSGIYVYDELQRSHALASRDNFQARLRACGYNTITTEIIDAPLFYYAEDYHQQYLAKNPGGYCGLGGTGVSCN